MRIGVSLRSGHGSVDPRTAARWMVERAAAARDAGLDSLFVGDHHATGTTYLQNTPILGRILAEWDDRPAGALFLLPLWHPVLVAEQVATLVAIAEGPFVLQVGLGDSDEQFRGMGASLAERAGALEGSLDIIRRLLAGETVTASEPVAVEGARIGPALACEVDVWVGAGVPRAIERAARLGDGWIAGPWLTPAKARESAAAYIEHRSRLGKAPGAVVVRRDVHVGSSEADARRVADPVFATGYRGMPREAAVVGGVPGVADSFAELAGAGYTDVLVRHLAGDQAEVLESFNRLGTVRDMVKDL